MAIMNIVRIIYLHMSMYTNKRGAITIMGTKTLSGNDLREKQERLLALALVFLGAFVVHIICAAVYTGYKTDMDCFFWWADAVFENGIPQFYHLDAFTDYPPGYMYILYVIGAIKKLFGMTSMTTGTIVLLKLPAMLCDLGIGYVIYKVASKYTKPNYALFFAAAYMFNPAVIINSCTWGQVDSVFTIFVVLMCYFVTEKKLPLAYLMLAIGILIKPQTLIFTPIVIFGIIDQVFLHDFTWKRMFKELGLGLLAIGLLFLLMLPFGLSTVLAQYVDTLGQYEYASVNAYNLWTLFGHNWAAQTDMFMFMSFKSWGTFFIIATVAASAWFCFKNKESESKYYITGAFIVFSVFMLSVRMHERYMYPALALLLITAAVKRNIKYVIAFAALSIYHFMNVYHVLFYYDPNTYDYDNPVLPAISFVGVVVFGYFCYVMFVQGRHAMEPTYEQRIALQNSTKKNGNKLGKNTNKNGQGKNQISEPKKKGWSIVASDAVPKWIKWDWIIMIGITVIYACIAFFNLGDMKAPETVWHSETTGTEINLDFGKEVTIGDMYCYLGSYENRKFELQYSSDGVNWTKYDAAAEGGSTDSESKMPECINFCSVFCWNKQSINYSGRYFKFIQRDDIASIIEFMMYDTEENVIEPVNASDYPEIFDEQDIFDGTMSFMNSTYFDEIYHARTAYEMINHMYCYENTHPPLGKFFISIGIRIFGMCPFGWRFMGTLFGVLMVPVMYILARKLTKKTWLASIFTVIFTFDFMHFAQSRIATIDVFVTLFIMLMYFFMLCYYKMSFNDTPLKKTFIPLALSGICMGLGCASKWTGVYAGIGLGIIFAAVMLRRYMEYKSALADPKGSTEGIEHKFVIDNYKLFTMKTLLACVLFFIVIPGAIYTCAYIPFSDGSNTGLINQLLTNQKTMFDYHSTLDATHPYSSAWYQWPIMTRPILFYLEQVSTTLSSGISSMGNPLVWWAGIPGFVYMLYLIFSKRDRVALFLTIGYLAQLIPWMGVSRCTFIYHYFPSVPFVALIVGYSLYSIYKQKPKFWIAMVIYAVAVVALFVSFYPVLSGLPITVDYAEHLKWFSSWVLLY